VLECFAGAVRFGQEGQLVALTEISHRYGDAAIVLIPVQDDFQAAAGSAG
jgi:hypothetical protein